MPPIIPFPQEIPSDSAENEAPNEQFSNFASDSESTSEDEDHDGYEPLSQDPENCNDNSSDLEDSNFLSDDIMEEGISVNPQSLLLPAPTSAFLETNENKESNKDLKMDEEHIETIKSVMKSITLPKSNVPQWANEVPEEEWKSVLLSEMQARKDGSQTASCVRMEPKDENDFSSMLQR